MKTVANQCFEFKNRLLPQNGKIVLLDTKYRLKSYLGLWRGYYQALKGNVYREDSYPLIIGSQVDIQIEARAAIYLKNNTKQVALGHAVNPFYLKAANIGLPPYWRFLNHPARQCTRLRLQENSRLICEPNSMITPGCYISIWPNQSLTIGMNSYIGHNTLVNTKSSLVIGSGVMIGFDCYIMDYDGHPIYQDQNAIGDDKNSYGGASDPIVIEDNVWTGFNVTILKGVRVGSGSMIAPNSVVTKEVPPNTIVAGNPAKVIKEGIVWKKF